MSKIKKIKLNIQGSPSVDDYSFGVNSEDVDYQIDSNHTKNVREILGEFEIGDNSIKEELNINKQHIENLANQMSSIEQDFSVMQDKFTQVEPKLDTLINLENNINNTVEKKINQKNFSTDNIIWTDGIPISLHKILGNLRNLPGGVSTLRDWIEKVSTGQGGSDQDGGNGTIKWLFIDQENNTEFNIDEFQAINSLINVINPQNQEEEHFMPDEEQVP